MIWLSRKNKTKQNEFVFWNLKKEIFEFSKGFFSHNILRVSTQRNDCISSTLQSYDDAIQQLFKANKHQTQVKTKQNKLRQLVVAAHRRVFDVWIHEAVMQLKESVEEEHGVDAALGGIALQMKHVQNLLHQQRQRYARLTMTTIKTQRRNNIKPMIGLY